MSKWASSKTGARVGYVAGSETRPRLYKHLGRIFTAWSLDHALQQLGADLDPTALRIWTGSEYVKCNVQN